MSRIIPADVPPAAEDSFKENYDAITRDTDRLLLYACDQKIEHLNADFVSSDAHPDAQQAEHLFTIAQNGSIGAMAAHVGLIARYAPTHPGINFIAKLNGKTPLMKNSWWNRMHFSTEPTVLDPCSAPLYTVEDALALKERGVAIRGIGMTCYLGSAHENKMLSFAAQSIAEAHRHGLVAVLWIYPRGYTIWNDQNVALLAGAAGLANALGSDFVKLKTARNSSAKDLRTIITAAGNTGVIFSGQAKHDAAGFLESIDAQLKAGAAGTATGRNIFQRSEAEAIALTRALSALIYEDSSLEQARKLLR